MKKELVLGFDIQAQPDEVTCGPTCLQALYNYYGDAIALNEVIKEVKQLKFGGTLAVMLGHHALKRGYKAHIYTYNLNVFDPTWFKDSSKKMVKHLQAQMEFKHKRRKLQVASAAYIKFLESGGRLRNSELDESLIKDYLKRSVPILTGLSATYLYGTAREIPQFDIYDSIKGEPSGHFVVITGYDEEKNCAYIADPVEPNPLGKGQVYSVSFPRLINSIMLGIVTYDANLLVIEPKEKRFMPKLIIVENPDNWQFNLEDVEVITPSGYISGDDYQDSKGLKVINLCKSYQYQSMGYYVSLLAEARRHKVLPGVSTIQDLRFPSILREDSQDFDDLIQASFKNETSDKVEFDIYFGITQEESLNKLAKQLFQYIQAPSLIATFTKRSKWVLQSIKPLSLGEVPEEDKPLLRMAVERYLQRKREVRPDRKKYDMAILIDPDDPNPPSNEKAIQKFIKAGDQAGFNVELITKEDFDELIQYDALFIRETTFVNHHTFRFAKKAQSLGLSVIDDPESILKCTNKVYLNELLTANKILTPKSYVVSKENYKSLSEKLPYPFILKQPDGAFSKGVFKIKDADEYKQVCSTMFQKSELLIAQEFLPTSFDWRVGIIDGKPLYVCKYFMASEHWQIVNWNSEKKDQEGDVESIAVDQAPSGLIRTALKATALIGRSLYGVDMKEVDGKFYVIEINDNPNIDAGLEDKILKEKLYATIMEVFLNKIKADK